MNSREISPAGPLISPLERGHYDREIARRANNGESRGAEEVFPAVYVWPGTAGAPGTAGRAKERNIDEPSVEKPFDECVRNWRIAV